jgi:hypothetical protein
MASVVIAGNTSGTVTLQAPDISGSTVLTLPTTSGTLVTTAGGTTVPFALGSAASPSITFTGDTNTGIFSPGADTIAFAEGGAEVARFDSSGNLGIGTSSPTRRLDVSGSSTSSVEFGVTNSQSTTLTAINTTGTTYGYAGVGGSTSWYYGNKTVALGTDSANPIQFVSNAAERMRIDSSGNLLVGVTSTTIPGYGNTTNGVALTAGNPSCFSISRADFVQVINQNTIDGSFFDLITFRTGGVQRGNILSNGSTVTYNTSSDYRLKENIAPMTGALAKVAQLKPCTYTWKETGQNSQGFIAHELAEVVPDCVSGEKDAVNEDGTIKAQGVDTSFLVATLTAAIQEQQAIINEQASTIAAFEARLVALENK